MSSEDRQRDHGSLLLDPNCQKKIPVKVRLYRATRVIVPTNEDTLTTILMSSSPYVITDRSSTRLLLPHRQPSGSSLNDICSVESMTSMILKQYKFCLPWFLLIWVQGASNLFVTDITYNFTFKASKTHSPPLLPYLVTLVPMTCDIHLMRKSKNVPLYLKPCAQNTS